jgi:hypothetical protein
MTPDKQARSKEMVGTSSASVRLSDEQRQALASALSIDVKFVPAELGVVGIPRNLGPRAGIPTDRAGQFAPALMMT